MASQFVGKPSWNTGTGRDLVDIQHIKGPTNHSNKESRSGFIDVDLVLRGDRKVTEHKDDNDQGGHEGVLQRLGFQAVNGFETRVEASACMQCGRIDRGV